MIYISAAGQKKIAKHASICVACFAEHLIKLISRFHSSCVRFNRNTFDSIVRIYQLFLLDLAQTFRPIEHQTRPTCWEHKPQIRFINSPTFFFFFVSLCMKRATWLGGCNQVGGSGRVCKAGKESGLTFVTKSTATSHNNCLGHSIKMQINLSITTPKQQ